MARIRSIKPEFWTSEQVMECSTNARLLFVGMWNFADDHGRLPANPKTIKAQVFPSDEDITVENVRRMVDELSTNGLIRIYVVDNKQFLFITGWHHQKIDKRQAAKYPEPPPEGSSNVRRTLATDLKGSDLKGSEGIGEDPKEPRERALADGWPEDFREQFWSLFPNKVGRKKAIPKLEACMRRGIQWIDIMTGLERYIASKPPDRSWMNPETFLTQERWTDQPATTTAGNGNGTHGIRSNPTSGSTSPGDDPIVAGMARALERRREARAAANPGRPDVRGCSDAASGDDPEPGAAEGDRGSHRQLAFLPPANTRGR